MSSGRGSNLRYFVYTSYNQNSNSFKNKESDGVGQFDLRNVTNKIKRLTGNIYFRYEMSLRCKARFSSGSLRSKLILI